MANPKNLAFNIGAAILAIVIVVGVVYFRGSRKEADRGVFFAQEEIRPTPTLTPLPPVIEEEIEEPLIAAPTPSSATPIAPPEFSDRYQEQMREKAKEKEIEAAQLAEKIRQKNILQGLEQYLRTIETQRELLEEALNRFIVAAGSDDLVEAKNEFQRMTEEYQNQRGITFQKLDSLVMRDGKVLKLEQAIFEFDSLVEKVEDRFPDRRTRESQLQETITQKLQAIDELIASIREVEGELRDREQ